MSLPQRPASEAPTALLAEDDELIRDIVTQYLEKLGFNVLEAQNGKVAVDIIDRMESGPLDLIVTDLLMPKVGGEAVIEAAQRRGLCNRFLIMSGYSEVSQQPSKASDASSYLEKPFTFGAFEEKLVALNALAAKSS